LVEKPDESGQRGEPLKVALSDAYNVTERFIVQGYQQGTSQLLPERDFCVRSQVIDVESSLDINACVRILI